MGLKTLKNITRKSDESHASIAVPIFKLFTHFFKRTFCRQVEEKPLLMTTEQTQLPIIKSRKGPTVGSSEEPSLTSTFLH